MTSELTPERNACVRDEPYVLAVCSHHGGAGRTTTAAALAWCCGQTGLAVTLIDAAPARSARSLAVNHSGECVWPNVLYHAGMPAPGRIGGDLHILDLPRLTEAEAGAILPRANGVILCCLADAVSLRTAPSAARAIDQVRERRPELELLGILVGIHNPRDALQATMWEELRRRHGELVLEPAIPMCRELRDWPNTPGSDLPRGPGADAFSAIADGLTPWIRNS